MAGMSLAHGSLDAYVCSANSVIEFKLIREENDIDNSEIAFNPEFTHQFFGDSESIFGYINLKVKLYYSASRLTTYLGMNYTERVNPNRSDGVDPDDVMKIIGERLQPGFLTNIDDFVPSLAKDANFVPYGELLRTVTVEDDNIKRTFEIYQADTSVPGFQAYHERMQTFVLWFIDAASYIDVDDERWDYFVMYERCVNNGHVVHYFVGYTTVYRYYAYPTKTRPRISQMLILPPFQKKGLGAELLQTVYNWYTRDRDVVDITVEDPSESFSRLRDFVDSRNCLKLKSFQPENLRKGFTEETRQEAQEILKLNKKQARRIYEILCLRIINTANKEEYKAYRLNVKKRLNSPYQRQQMDLNRLQKTLKPEELKATLNCTTREQRIEQLDRQYKELETEYRHVLERLAMEKLD